VQKYIQKIGFKLLILFTIEMALNAQEMKLSNPIKLNGVANFLKVLGENSGWIIIPININRNFLILKLTYN
jgi:hypothetical protein